MDEASRQVQLNQSLLSSVATCLYRESIVRLCQLVQTYAAAAQEITEEQLLSAAFNLSPSFFLGVSLSTSHVFTHSLTHSQNLRINSNRNIL